MCFDHNFIVLQFVHPPPIPLQLLFWNLAMIYGPPHLEVVVRKGDAAAGGSAVDAVSLAATHRTTASKQDVAQVRNRLAVKRPPVVTEAEAHSLELWMSTLHLLYYLKVISIAENLSNYAYHLLFNYVC